MTMEAMFHVMRDLQPLETSHQWAKATEDLFAAAACGDVAASEQALRRGANIESCDPAGLRPLALASIALSPQLVELLLQKGASPNVQDERFKRSALHCVALEAAAGRNLDAAIRIAELLTGAGASIQLRDSASKTALQLAQYGNGLGLEGEGLISLLRGTVSANTNGLNQAAIPIGKVDARVDTQGLATYALTLSTLPVAVPPHPRFGINELVSWVAENGLPEAIAFANSARRPICVLLRTNWARDYEAPLLNALADSFNNATATVCQQFGLYKQLAKVDPEKKGQVNATLRASVLNSLASGQSVLMLASEAMVLDTLLLELVAFEIVLPRFCPESLSRAFEQLRPGAERYQVPNEDWIYMVGLQDLMVTCRCSDRDAIDVLREQVMQRISSLKPQEGAISLQNLHGLGAAKQWAQNLIADMQAANKGEIDWAQVDRGALLEGPPGVGKTTVARAIANDSGMRMVATTASSWQAAGHLSDVLQAMEKDFERAAEMAPCVLFIDEIDAIGSRSDGGAGSQEQWVTWSVNHLLALMDGFSKSRTRRIVLLGATNHASKVDAALRRSGRLDRLITIPLPNRPALEAIYGHYLNGFAHALSRENISELAQCSVGASGADVERYVREARRRARLKNRDLIKADVLESVYNTPSDDVRQPMQLEELEYTAWHEAGHAVMMWAGPDKAATLNYISVVPRADGSLGFMAHGSQGRFSVTRAQALHRLEVLMAGRAAEELRFGRDGVSSGCQADLQSAAQLAETFISKMGLGKSRRLSSTDSNKVWESLADDVEAELQQAYTNALATLSANRVLVERVAQALMEKSEISGPDFLRIAAAYRHETASCVAGQHEL
jgi:ATP-dependent Zn protease